MSRYQAYVAAMLCKPNIAATHMQLKLAALYTHAVASEGPRPRVQQYTQAVSRFANTAHVLD